MADVLIDFDVPVPMSDGTTLRADVYRPGGGAGPWPVLLQRGPYGKRGPSAQAIDTLAVVARGYIVVQQDTRGRFASEGEWQPFDHEISDGRDTVAWAATLPGSSGEVGMFGVSYTGSTQWSAAISGAPALRAIAPGLVWADPLDGLYQRGGATELGLNGFWSLMTGASHLPRRYDGRDLMVAFRSLVTDFDGMAKTGYWELPAGRLPAITRYGGPDIGTEASLNDPTAELPHRVAGRHDAISVPAYHIAGWYDAFEQGVLDSYAAMAATGTPAKLLVGPWTHFDTGAAGGSRGEINYGLQASVTSIAGRGSLTDFEVRWFDHWLKREDTGVLDEPPVKIFVMGANVWRDENEWPLARAVDTDFYLGTNGTLGTLAPTADDDGGHDDYTYDPADPAITRGGAVVMTPDFPPGPADQSVVEAREDVLVYTSDVLDADVEVTGRIRATLFATTDGPSTDWVVRLCDVDAEGVSRNLTDGILRAKTEPGAVGEYEVDLWSTSNVFLAGHRIRLHITSSNFPRWDRNPNTGEPATEATTFRVARQRIHRDRSHPSRITLPIIPPSS